MTTFGLQKYGLRVTADYTAVEVPAGRVTFTGEGVLDGKMLTLTGKGVLNISGEITLKIQGFGHLELETRGFTYGSIGTSVKHFSSIALRYSGRIEDVVRIDHLVELEDGAEYRERIAARVSGQLDLHTEVHHRGAAQSNIENRVVVEKGGKVIVRSNVTLGPSSTGSLAHEKIDALLLDASAEVNVLPTMTVDTNNVTAKHSASVGRLDADALFYFASRGVTPVEAKAKLAEAFLRL